MSKFMNGLEKAGNAVDRVGKGFLGAFLACAGVALSILGIKTVGKTFEKSSPAAEPKTEVPETPAAE